MKLRKPKFINDFAYITHWTSAVSNGRAFPDQLRRSHGAPRCDRCWDTGLCPDCLGRYPQYCPTVCDDGTCGCDAGRARRATYQASLKEHGL